MIIWVSARFKPSLARQACVLGNRDDHLGLWDCGTRRMRRKREGGKIIQAGQENLDGINRMVRMNGDKNEMIIWVCGTVGFCLKIVQSPETLRPHLKDCQNGSRLGEKASVSERFRKIQGCCVADWSTRRVTCGRQRNRIGSLPDRPRLTCSTVGGSWKVPMS